MSGWKPSSFIRELDQGKFSLGPDLVTLVVHIHYIEFVDRLFLALENSETSLFSRIVVTTTSDQVASRVRLLNSEFDFRVEVRVYNNRGRNFGPLLDLVSGEPVKTKYLIHLHSKKSTNRESDLSAEWVRRTWGLLLEQPSLLKRCLWVMESNSKISTISPLVSDFIPPDAFSWLENEEHGSFFKGLFGNKLTPERFAFPAGGMFLARTESLSTLFNLSWSSEVFPEELGQLDGTLQHAVERGIGLIPTMEGWIHVFFDWDSNMFTSDSSFVHSDLDVFVNNSNQVSLKSKFSSFLGKFRRKFGPAN
jgi:lipopolysaccharide biosynthesis protein